MNGAEILIKTAIAAGIEVCFVNAGTTELPVVTAFDSIPGIKPILGLFEGVCTGSADGYGRMMDRPAMTLLHLGPGFANGIANLHNARRAHTPVFNVIGEHATWHRGADAPLTMDIEALTGTVSGWQCTSKSIETLSRDIANGIANAWYGQIASLIVPNDHLLTECIDESISPPKFSFDPVDSDSIEKAAQLFRNNKKVALMLGARALRKQGLQAAARIKNATGCDLFTETFPGYMERGVGLPVVERVPYFPEKATARLSQYQAVILAGSKEPVTFFGYQGIDSEILKKNQLKIHIGTGRQNVVEALEYLADALNTQGFVKKAGNILAELTPLELPQGELTGEKACRILAALQPENAIIVDEGITTSFDYYPLTGGIAPHSLMAISGGSIGYGMPCALGAQVACPDRPVINLQADGSALYTVQALWSEARESLNVTTLICSNRSYHILDLELLRSGITSPGPRALSLIDLIDPSIDWVKIASGLGVPAVSVSTAEGLTRELGRALQEPGPHLIEMVLK